jgi:hypothetical protein
VDDDLILVRMRIQGARQAIADALGVSGAIKKLSDSTRGAAAASDEATRKGFLYQQGLFTLRRAAYAATFGLTGLGTAAVIMGFKFNASMESNQLVMTQFLGSASAARRELGSLFTLAATGPFEFTNLVSSARQFLAFGFGLRETNRDLRILSDTAAGLQLGGAGIEHLVMVFGQIRASGRLLGQDMLQLQQAGINVRGILQRELGLSKAQMTDLAKGTLSIPSEVAIPAIFAGLNRTPQQGGFRGLSQKLQGTFTALMATAHDYASQLFGTITHPWFLDAERSLRRLNPLLLQAGQAYKQGGMDALFQTLDRGLGANGRLVASWQDLRAAGQDVNRILRGAVIPAFGILWATLGLGSPPMQLALGLLGALSRHTTLLKGALVLLAAWFVYTRSVELAFRVATRLTALDLYKLTGVTKGSTAAMKAYALWTYKAEIGASALRKQLLLIKGLGVIGITYSIDYILGNILPQAPNRQMTGSGSGIANRLTHAESRIPILGKLQGAGNWLGDEILKAVGVDPDKGSRPRVQPQTVDAQTIGQAIANNLRIVPADVKMDGQKVADITFGWQQTAAARG